MINADGLGQRQLTPWSLNGSDPDWSPDGNLILFRSVPGRDQHGNLYTINADGSDLKQLTRYPAPKALFAGSLLSGTGSGSPTPGSPREGRASS